jgi:hypothetical protein
MPEAIMTTIRTVRDVRVTAGGQTYTGSYEVKGKVVEVWSAWGSGAGVVKRGDPKETAQDLLAGIVAARG